MTPSVPAPAPSPTSPAPSQKPTREVSAKDNFRTKTGEADKPLTETKDASEKTSVTMFEEMMAALLTMQPAAPSKEQGPTIDIKPPANDEISETPYNPPLILTPQPQQHAPPPVNVSGEFCPDFISALTPGLPAPLADTTAATVSAPVPIVANEGSPALKTFNDTPADPRVIAAGLTPQEMEAFKEQLAAAQKQAPTATQAPQTSSVDPQQASAAPAPQAQTTQPVTTNTQMTPPVQPLNVITVNLLPGAEPALPAVVTAQAADVAAPSEPVLETETLAVAEDTEIKGDFDPVEFRIAQKYHRAASTPRSVASPSSMTEVKTNPALNADARPAPQSQNANPDLALKGKVDTEANFSFSLSSSAAFGVAASDALSTVTPTGLPLSVTTLTSPVTQNISAAQSHPAVQTVAAVINKAAKENTSQTISLRLDPPDLGRLEVQMKYKKGDPLKVHVVLEKADTAAMFQRDAHALEAALKDAGVQADSSSLSFEMAKDGNSFQGQMNQGDNKPSQSAAMTSDIADSSIVETSMDIATDSRTGLTHYNIRA